MNKEKKDKIILITVIFFILLAFSHRLYFSIMIKNIKELNSEITGIDKKINEAQKKSNDLTGLTIEYNNIKNRVNALDKTLYTKDELKLIKNIWKSAASIGFSILEVKPENNVNNNELIKDNHYFMAYNASFESLYNFTRYCKTLPANLKIERISVNGSKTGIVSGKIWFFIRSFKEDK